MLKTDNARVVNVASDHHSHCKQLNVDDLNFEHDSSVGKMSSLFKIYGISKLCNVLFSLELANKLKPLGENNLLKIFYLTEAAQWYHSVKLKILLGFLSRCVALRRVLL